LGNGAMKVGELASRTGLSVRALHHYDEIGLLRPSQRTRAGHRVYGMAEIRRLQQIASLRVLGLSLEEIRGCLDRPEYALERVLALHIERIRSEMERQGRLVELLDGLRRKAAGREPLSVDAVTAAIEGTLHFERYYTPEQRSELAERAEALGAEGLRKAQEEWAALFRALDEARLAGVPAGDPGVQTLAARARELIHAFTGGDPGIQAGLERMYREKGGAAAMEHHGIGMDPALWEYYGRVMREASGS
jgi:DNA-binding transcriptional MerR regulator